MHINYFCPFSNQKYIRIKQIIDLTFDFTGQSWAKTVFTYNNS